MILFQFLSYGNKYRILYKNTFYNYDELQMSSCAVYFILNTVLVYINRKLVHAEYISICYNASNTCKVLFQILSRFGDVILNLSSKKAATSKGVSIFWNFSPSGEFFYS